MGCGLTVWALHGAYKAIKTGRHEDANKMFRRRIYAQAFTITMMVIGNIYWKEDRKKRREYDKVVEERKAKEKQAAWVRELEARDEEEKEFQAKLQKARMMNAAKGKSEDSKVERPGVLQAVAEVVKKRKKGAKEEPASTSADGAEDAEAVTPAVTQAVQEGQEKSDVP